MLGLEAVSRRQPELLSHWMAGRRAPTSFAGPGALSRKAFRTGRGPCRDHTAWLWQLGDTCGEVAEAMMGSRTTLARAAIREETERTGENEGVGTTQQRMNQQIKL